MGILAALITSLFLTSKDIVSKKLSLKVDSTSSTFASFAYAIPFYLVIMLAALAFGHNAFAVSQMAFGILLMRSITDLGAEWLKMKALETGEMSVVASFLSLSPIFLLLLSPIITGDKPSQIGVLAILLVVLGSLVAAYQPKQNFRSNIKAILLALGTSLFFSLNNCFDRLAVQQASPLASAFWMTLLSGLFLTPVLFSKKRVETLKLNQSKFLARGFFEVAFMVSKLTALQYLQAPYVTAITRISLIFSILAGHFIFKEENVGRKLLAGFIILVGVVLVVLA